MSRYPAPSPTYLGPPKFLGGSDNKPLTHITIHATVSRCRPGGARANARYFKFRVIRPSSAHYVVDPLAVVQVTYDSTVAYHAPPNRHSLGVELCDIQDERRPRRWRSFSHQRMLRRAARLVARLCLAYDIPPVRLTAHDLTLGRHGICGHVDVSHAFGETSHTDPGPNFPWNQFMHYVGYYYRKYL